MICSLTNGLWFQSRYESVNSIIRVSSLPLLGPALRHLGGSKGCTYTGGTNASLKTLDLPLVLGSFLRTCACRT
jgi:hypothetical protein